MDIESMFRDLHFDGPIRKAGKEVRAVESTARKAVDGVSDVRESLDRLALICQSMWELLSERTELSEDDLLAKVREVDLRDGTLDGKAPSSPKECPGCKRLNNARREACLYCCAELPGGTAFDSI